jgi:hypothetical protein
VVLFQNKIPLSFTGFLTILQECEATRQVEALGIGASTVKSVEKPPALQGDFPF